MMMASIHCAKRFAYIPLVNLPHLRWGFMFDW